VQKNLQRDPTVYENKFQFELNEDSKPLYEKHYSAHIDKVSVFRFKRSSAVLTLD